MTTPHTTFFQGRGNTKRLKKAVSFVATLGVVIQSTFGFSPSVAKAFDLQQAAKRTSVRAEVRAPETVKGTVTAQSPTGDTVTTGTVCPTGDVKLNIGSGYEYTDGSATITGNGTQIQWDTTAGFEVTNVCVKIGGPGGGSLQYPPVSNSGLAGPYAYDISHVVVTTRPLTPELTSCTLYGYHDESLDDSQFFRMNLQTGTVTDIGAVATNEDLEAIDAHPTTGVMYGFPDIGSDDSSAKLVTIDRTTGTRTFVANVSNDFELPGASFNPATGELWGGADTNDNLYTIDLATGAPTLRLDASKTGEPQALAWNNAGTTLFVAYNDKIYTTNGTSALVQVADVSGEVEAMEFDENNNLLLALHGSANLYVLIGGNLVDTDLNFNNNDIETLTTACPEPPRTGSLRITKVVDSGSALPHQFGFRLDGTGGYTYPANGQDAVVFENLTPGTFSATETGPSGYHQVSSTCDGIAVISGQQASCVFHNARDTGRLIVNKEIDEDRDGTYESGNDRATVLGFRWGLDSGATNRVMGTAADALPTGTHFVDENDVAGYEFAGWYQNPGNETNSCSHPQSGPLPLSVNVAADALTEITLCNRALEQPKGNLAGVKYEDRNNNGHKDPGEPGIASVRINLSDGQFLFTDANGAFTFVDLTPGLYTVGEVVPAGWINTTPATLTDIEVRPNDTTNVKFGNFKLGRISGSKFNDLNGNGHWDAEEPTLAGWTIQLTGPENRTAVTDENGFYAFGSLPIGSYTVAEEQQPGWTQTTADEGPVSTGLSGTDAVRTFGNFHPGKISGYKFEDEEGQQPLNDWEICAIPEFEGDSIESPTCVLTGAGEWPDGYYEFSSLTPGRYTIRETLRDGWTAVDPSTGEYTDVLYTSNCAIRKDFVNRRDVGAVSVNKLLDADGNGSFEGQNADANAIGFRWGLDSSGTTNQMGSTLNSIPTGAHTVTENGLAGYHFVGWYRTGDEQRSCANPEGVTLPATLAVSNGATAGLTLCNARDVVSISLDKTGPATAAPGETINYTLAWSVSGTVAATNAVISDPLPANTSFVSADCGTTTGFCAVDATTSTITWSLGTRAPGASGTVTLRVKLATPLTDGTVITNVGTFDTNETDPVTDTVPTTVRSGPSISIAKSDAPDPVAAGANLTYTVTWTIGGNAPATNVTVTDPVPANTTFVSADNGGTFANGTVTWLLGTKNPGDTGKLSFIVKVASPIANGTILTNTATIDSTENDPVSAAATTTVSAAPSLSITKTSNITTFTNPGQTVTYTVVVTNAASATDTAKNVNLTDTLPTGFTFTDGTTTKTFAIGNLAPGASKTVTFDAVVSESIAAGTYVNTAKAKGDNTPEVTATADVPVRIPQVLSTSQAKLTITKTAKPTVANPGTALTYSIVVKNVGDATAENVVITDTLPKGLSYANFRGALQTFPIGDLKPGQSFLLSIDAKVNDSAAAGEYVNVATAKADNAPAVTDDATVTVRTVKVLAETGASFRDLLIAGLGLLLLTFGLALFLRRPDANLIKL